MPRGRRVNFAQAGKPRIQKKAKQQEEEEEDDLPDLVPNDEMDTKEEHHDEEEESEEDDDDEEYDEEEQQRLNEMWSAMWLLMLEYLDDEYMFLTFRDSLQRTLDRMNPLMNLYTQGMSENLLEKLLMECQLANGASKQPSEETVKEVQDTLPKVIALLQSGKKVRSDEDEEDRTDEEIVHTLEKQLQWGIGVREVRIGTWDVQRSWLRQFMLQADPVNKNLNLSMFRFVSEDMPEEVAMEMVAGPSRELMQHFQRQFNRFQVSRLLQMRMPFSTIDKIYLHQSDKNEELGLLIVELTQPPGFFTKRINTQHAESWRERTDFTDTSAASKYKRIYMSGDYDFLENIVTALVCSDDSFKAKLVAGMEDIGDDSVKYDPPAKRFSANPRDKRTHVPLSTLAAKKEEQESENNNSENKEEKKETEEEKEAALYSDVDSDEDQPEWPGWKEDPVDEMDPQSKFMHAFANMMGMNPEDLDDEDDDAAQAFFQAFPGMVPGMEIPPGAMPPGMSQFFGQMGAEDEDDEDDEDYEPDEDEEDNYQPGHYHGHGGRGGAPPCAQQ